MVIRKEYDTDPQKKWYADGRWADVIARFITRTRFHIRQVTKLMPVDIGDSANYHFEQYLVKKGICELIKDLDDVLPDNLKGQANDLKRKLSHGEDENA